MTGPVYEALRRALAADRPAALATITGGPGIGAKLLVIAGEDPIGTLGDPELDRVVARDASGELAAARTEQRHYGRHGEAGEETVTVFVESFAPPPQMLIFGAVDFTAALVRASKLLGFQVTVCDAREVFATTVRFPEADEVVVDWPNRLLDRIGHRLGPRDAICVLTHDAKFDVPAIVEAVKTDVGYLGAMGSRHTHAKRCERLREAGLSADQIDRVLAPIGLDIGSRSPEEVAISVLAEVIANRTGRSAPSLRDGRGPIHP